MATDVVKAAADKKAKARKAATPLPKNYWKVELVRPPGVSAGVTAYITLAEGAIQNAVDLLGRGVPKPPPDVQELLQPVVYETVGKGEATEAYQKIIDTVEATQTWLVMEDAKVIKTSVRVAAEQNMTLKGIQRVVADLNSELKAVGTAKLKPPQETALLKQIVTAIEAVYKKVMAVAELNEDIANGGDKPNPTQPKPQAPGTPAPPAGNNGGGGPSILDQLMPMLGMLPMMAMPLAQMIPEMMKKEEEARKDREEEQNRTPPAAAAQPPSDRATPPAEAAPPVTAAPIAAASDDSGQDPAASGISATPVSLMRPAARSRRRAAEQAGSAEGTQQQADDDDEVDDAAADAPLTVDI
ncbi:hypothetical protein ACLMAL_36240 [Nocardia sp. CWNU-33]|uniref:hypothetical protein n=1 Tax=Nocardia sp. CWNU-33 TaxID=3392117 RepID=UPI00398ED735